MKTPKSVYQAKKTLPQKLLWIIIGFFVILLILWTSIWLWDININSLIITSYSMLSFLLLIIVWVSTYLKKDIITKYTGTILFILTLWQIVYSTFLIISDFISLVWYPISWINPLWLSISIVIIILCIYGSIIGTHNYTIKNIKINIEWLPESFDGYKIVQISDIHSGSIYKRSALQRWIDLINNQKADLFVFTGDLVNNKAEEFDQRKDIFSQIKANDGCYSILGNHDYGEYTTWTNDIEKSENNLRIRQHHSDIWWNLLLNSHVSLQKDGEHIALIGIQNRWDSFSQYGDLDEACYGIHPDEICILLSHDPSHRDKRVRYYNKHNIVLTLSGHTHGMQFGIDWSRIKRSPIKYRYPFWIWLYKEAQRHLYVNRGFWVLGLNARVGINPEITVLELKRQ